MHAWYMVVGINWNASSERLVFKKVGPPYQHGIQRDGNRERKARSGMLYLREKQLLNRERTNIGQW